MTTSAFRLSKTTKRMLGLGHFKTKEQRNAWKRAMIDAEWTASIAVKHSSKKDRSKKED